MAYKLAYTYSLKEEQGHVTNKCISCEMHDLSLLTSLCHSAAPRHHSMIILMLVHGKSKQEMETNPNLTC